MPSKPHHHVSPHHSEEGKKKWQIQLAIPAEKSFESTDSFLLELTLAKFPVGGTIGVKTSGPVDFDIAPFKMTHGDIDLCTEVKSGLELPYTTKATIEWHQGDGNPLCEHSHVECKLVHITLPDHDEEDEHLSGATKLLGATRKSASKRYKLNHA